MAASSIEAALAKLDDPINSFEQDLLQRKSFVDNLAKIMASAPANGSTVFALCADWGAGKTSIKNLLKGHFAKHWGTGGPLIVEFNPWAFSGQDQVLEAFFLETAKAIGRDRNGNEAAAEFKKLGAHLSFGATTAKNVHLWLDLFGIPGAKLVGVLGEALGNVGRDAKDYGEQLGNVAKRTLQEVQDDLRYHLEMTFKRSVLIILDDLDRLTPDQLLLVFQIVKANASLPRINFLLLMDRTTVVNHLKARQLGADFVEKIVQFEFTLPHVTALERKAILKEGFIHTMGPLAASIEWPRWDEAWALACQNIFNTLRRIKRFLHTFRFHLQLFISDGVLEVNAVDLFLIEVLRTSYPQLHDELPSRLRFFMIHEDDPYYPVAFIAFTKPEEFRKELLDSIIALVENSESEALRALLKILFPQVDGGNSDEQGWLRDRRACHALYFESYFKLTIPQGSLTKSEIEALVRSLPDAAKTRDLLQRYYTKVGLRVLLVHIDSHHDQLPADGIVSLLSELWRLDELDARTLGLESMWEPRLWTQDLTRCVVKRHLSDKNRAQFLLSAFQKSETIYPLARFVRSEHHRIKEGDFSQVTITEEDIDVLRPHIVARLKKAAASGELLNFPKVSHLLYIWSELDTVQAVKEWVSRQISDVSRIPRLLSGFIEKGTESQGRRVRTYYQISCKYLADFLELTEAFAVKLNAIDQSSLSTWEKLAIDQTLQCIAQKKRDTGTDTNA